MPEDRPAADDQPPHPTTERRPAAPPGAASGSYYGAETHPPAPAGAGDPADATGAPARRGCGWWWLLPILVLAAGVFYLTHRQPAGGQATTRGGPGGRGNRPVPIIMATAAVGSIHVYISALGAVTPVNTVTVTSRVQGQIMNVNYREGQMVRKGDALLTVDPRPYQAALVQVSGQLDHDQAVLDEARIDLDRYKAAKARNAIPAQQLDDQEKVVLQDEGTVKNDQGQVETAKLNLQYCNIVSPIDGRVGLRLVDSGNIVLANSTTGLVVITQLKPITVVLSIAEDYLPQIQEQLRQGHTMPVDAFDRSQQTKIASGSLLTLDNVIDATTGTVKLKAIFPNDDGALFPSQFVNARLLVNTLQGVTLVPSAAVQRNAQGAFVYEITADQKAQTHPVTVGTSEGTLTAVTGIDPGTVVAVNGFDKLLDGIRVTAAGSPQGSGTAGQRQKGHGGGTGGGGNGGTGANGQPGQAHGQHHRRQSGGPQGPPGAQAPQGDSGQ
jgi:multidrug efflux system membrane fusion protein